MFPTDEDVKLWDSLTPEEQEAVLLRDIDEAIAGGTAKNTSKEEVMAEALAELNDGI